MLWTLCLGCLVGSVAFSAPSSQEQTAAIGSLTELPKADQRYYEPGDDFAPIPAPGGNDWLAQHPEPGQTYDAFIASHPQRVDKTRSKIYLLMLQTTPAIPDKLVEQMKACASAYFGMDVLARAEVGVAGQRFTTRINSFTKKQQILSTDVLAYLEKRVPEDAYCLLALTMVDLYPEPSWNFVFGQASLRNRVGVYSFARYEPALEGLSTPENRERLFLLRGCKVLVHETAHMFGLGHCVHFSCVVNGTNRLKETDNQPLHFCPVCLRKLQHCIGFDVRKQYEAQLRFCQTEHLDDEAAWLTKRLSHVSPP